MADKKQTCGTTPITFPGECTYVCVCTPQGGCHWSVTCGDWTTSGVGLTTEPPRDPHVTIVGDLEVGAKILQKRWKRRVIVPRDLRGKTMRIRTLTGTPEQIAQALGLRLGS
jgi:hypothetical protein